MTRRKQPVRSGKKNATRKRFIKESCGPNPRRKNSVSCYTDSTLLKMKDLWNARQSFGRINSDNPKQIWKELKENLKYVCNRESCWIRSELLNGNHVLTEKEKKLVQNSFAPRAPEKSNDLAVTTSTQQQNHQSHQPVVQWEKLAERLNVKL